MGRAVIEAEKSLLGAIMINGSMRGVPDTLRSEHFLLVQHRAIFKAMRDLAADGVKLDMVTVPCKLEERGLLEDCGGYAYVSGLVDKVPDVENVAGYAQCIKEASALRAMERIAGAKKVGA